MRKTKEEAEITRQNLLAAALKIFSEQGYTAAKLADIAEEAEVTRGAIYHHFGGKAELYKELLNEYSTRGNQIVNDAINEGGTIIDILSRTLIRQMEVLEEDTEIRSVIELSLFKTAGDPELEEVIQSRREQSEAMVQMLSGVMEQAINDGLLRPDLNPTQAARAYVAFQQGITYLWLFNPSAFSIKKEATGLTEIFMSGLTVRG